MTKKFICPKCKQELDRVLSNVAEYHVYRWFLDTNENPFMGDSVYEESETKSFECPGCNYTRETLEEFIVEEEQ